MFAARLKSVALLFEPLDTSSPKAGTRFAHRVPELEIYLRCRGVLPIKVSVVFKALVHCRQVVSILTTCSTSPAGPR
jgi:hypothetical protein